MMPSDQRSFLLRVFKGKHASDVRLSHWEFTREDEAALFEFIHPSVNTRAPDFTLFNLPVKWDKPNSALVEATGTRHALTTVDGDGENQRFAELCAKFEREGAHPEQAAKAAKIVAAGGEVDWSYGYAYEKSRSTL